MYSLIILLYLHGSLGITHLDNFNSLQLCDKAGRKVMLRSARYPETKVEYVCALEID